MGWIGGWHGQWTAYGAITTRSERPTKSQLCTKDKLDPSKLLSLDRPAAIDPCQFRECPHGERIHENEGVYLDRTIGGDCHHCHSGRHAASRLGQGQGKGSGHLLHEQSQAAATGLADVSGRPSGILASQPGRPSPERGGHWLGQWFA